MGEISSYFWWDTVYSADSVEWCPDEEFSNLLLCGTYKLEDDSESVKNEPQTRIGLLHLLSLSKTSIALVEEKTIETDGILDIKWSPFRLKESAAFVVADAIGTITLYSIVENHGKYDLLSHTRYNIKHDDKENIALSVDWSQNSEGKLAVSDSNGYISLLKYDVSASEFFLISQWKGHEFEAWIVAFDYINDSLVYSGGDDSKMCVFDVRTDIPSVLIGSKTVNSAGVTSLHCSSEGIVASGSYDESIHIWDSRIMKRSIGCIDKVGGGVWRLKWCPLTLRLRKDYLLAACMHGGFRIVDCKDKTNPNIVSSFTEHESLAYGADWCYLPSSSSALKFLNKCNENVDNLQDRNTKIIATCSFYDHKLSLSTVDMMY